jgi:hypothetical protein
MIATRRTREVLSLIKDGSIYEECHKQVPKGHTYIDNFPNPLTVVLLNLGCYYLITRQSDRMRNL